jgi:aryl-alcohol dehydrogenase-like predicted oxidoreductase
MAHRLESVTTWSIGEAHCKGAIRMRTTKLGQLTVSAQGLGCMGMSEWYGATEGFVPYAPLGRGFLTATVDLGGLDNKDFRRRNPRFTGPAGQANLAIVDAVRAVAEATGVAPAQVALAWVYAQQQRLGVPVAPIPGTKRVKWLEQNVAALDVTLSADELSVLDPLGAQVTGARY